MPVSPLSPKRESGKCAMPDVAASGQFELVVEPRCEQYHPDDDRWRDQLTALYADLQEAGGLAAALRAGHRKRAAPASSLSFTCCLRVGLSPYAGCRTKSGAASPQFTAN